MSNQRSVYVFTKAGFDFVHAEVQAVHAACDLAGVPRETEDGEKLSMSQRVKALAEANVSLGESLDSARENLDNACVEIDELRAAMRPAT